jgi:hypothetical protein
MRPLRGRSVREVATRLRQQAATQLDRFGVGVAARLPQEGELLKNLGVRGRQDLRDLLHAGPMTRVFPALANPSRTAGQARVRWPDGADATVARAERILEGRFDLLGLRNISFGEPVDWHLDPISGRRAPRVHWSRIDPLDPAQVGDHKVVWELNRHQYLFTLCRAWLLTGDDRFAAGVIRYLEEWMEANPPKVGVNWVSSLELAYRSIAWLWALSALVGRFPIPASTLVRALGFLWLQGHHVEKHLSTYFSPNTHLTGEALGLLYLGTLLTAFREAPRWRELGWRILVDQVDRQVGPDGTYFERATYYHRYTVDIYTHALLLGRAIGASTQELERVQCGLGRLLDHLAFLTRPDGTIPLLGDDDGGHVWFPDPDRPNDVRPALAHGAALLTRPDLAFLSKGAAEETLWLLGEQGLAFLDAMKPEPPTETSRAFPQGGFFVFRDGWAGSSSHMVVDAGAHGVLNCGHAHADALSFDLTVNGLPVLVDPGTFTYADPVLRNAFREALAHNTATVDGEGASTPGRLFQWERVTDVTPGLWTAGPRFDYLSAHHAGFSSIAPLGIHRREVVFARTRGWLIRDRLDLAPGHRVSLTYQVAPGLVLEETDDGCVICDGAGRPVLHLFHVLMNPRSAALRSEISQGSVSDAYARREPAPRWEVQVTGTPAEVLTLMLPGPSLRPEMEISQSEPGYAIHFNHQETEHLVLAGAGEEVVWGSWETDARLLWWCRAERSAEDRALAVGAARLRLDACRVLAGKQRVEVSEWRRVDGGWEMITEVSS